ncbi:MAG: hypothetical protein HY726_23390 [Candidatus Rokubacteria bacterium]|nr:hypothetical protein [Candidatus Rokubacteria bacterium]
MAYHALSENFRAFFRRLNPSPTFVQQASREHQTIVGLIEDRTGLAAPLAPQCFLQGSYRQDTAIYTINDVDVVALCCLWQPGHPGSGPGWSRDDIFRVVAAPLLADRRYRDKVRYGARSMCIKVELGIRIEILPVVYRAGNNDPMSEPFRLCRPESRQWEDGYARLHQAHLSAKNAPASNNFIPMIKVLKHLRSYSGLQAASFHLECLLFSVPHYVFSGGPAEYIPAVLWYIRDRPAVVWYLAGVRTPCGERNIFTASEWALREWLSFHGAVCKWAAWAKLAAEARDRSAAITFWRVLLGPNFFPEQVGE